MWRDRVFDDLVLTPYRERCKDVHLVTFMFFLLKFFFFLTNGSKPMGNRWHEICVFSLDMAVGGVAKRTRAPHAYFSFFEVFERRGLESDKSNGGYFAEKFCSRALWGKKAKAEPPLEAAIWTNWPIFARSLGAFCPAGLIIIKLSLYLWSCLISDRCARFISYFILHPIRVSYIHISTANIIINIAIIIIIQY